MIASGLPFDPVRQASLMKDVAACGSRDVVVSEQRFGANRAQNIIEHGEGVLTPRCHRTNDAQSENAYIAYIARA